MAFARRHLFWLCRGRCCCTPKPPSLSIALSPLSPEIIVTIFICVSSFFCTCVSSQTKNQTLISGNKNNYQEQNFHNIGVYLLKDFSRFRVLFAFHRNGLRCASISLSQKSRKFYCAPNNLIIRSVGGSVGIPNIYLFLIFSSLPWSILVHLIWPNISILRILSSFSFYCLHLLPAPPHQRSEQYEICIALTWSCWIGLTVRYWTDVSTALGNVRGPNIFLTKSSYHWLRGPELHIFMYP